MNGNPNWRTKGRDLLEILTVLSRWVVGGLFIYMGMYKALHPVEFLKLVRQYDMVSSPLLLNSIAAALPWFETICGALLITGVAVRGTAVMLLAMLIPFTLIVLKRALAIQSLQALAFCAVKFDCGCGTGEVYICHKLAENCGLILLSAWLLAGRGRQFCLRYGIMKPSPAV
jgi:uncharacterized membrane protein YphA (DoxX/SURF4 family)